MNLDDQHIQVPRLGQVPTEGNRFKAILKVSKTLHYLQQLDNFANHAAIVARRRLGTGYWAPTL